MRGRLHRCPLKAIDHRRGKIVTNLRSLFLVVAKTDSMWGVDIVVGGTIDAPGGWGNYFLKYLLYKP